MKNRRPKVSIRNIREEFRPVVDNRAAYPLRGEEVEKLLEHEVEKTPEQILAGVRVLGAMEGYARELVGEEDAKAIVKGIYIIKDEEVDQKAGKCVNGFVDDRGYIFVKESRSKSLPDFMKTVAHEVSHCISYNLLEVSGDNNVDYQTGEGISIEVLRAGFVTKGPKKEGRKEKFKGINEAVVELMSADFRSQMKRDGKTGLIEEEQEGFEGISAYHGPVFLLLGLEIDLLLKKEGTTPQIYELQKETYRNLITGKNSFLQKVEKARPGAVKILSEMGTSNQEAYEVAKKLGLDSAVEMMEMVIPNLKK